MKNFLVIFTSALILGIAAESANAQNPATALANAAATIVQPIAIVNNVHLNFGNIAAGATAGTVVLSPAGVRTPTHVILPNVTGTVSAAQFTVTGLAGANYSISLPVSVALSSGGNSITVNNFTEDAVTQVLTGGTDTFNVGATLAVGANQAVGLYTGTFNVTVDYQ